MSAPIFAPVPPEPEDARAGDERLFESEDRLDQADLETIRQRTQQALSREEDARATQEAKWRESWELLRGEHDFTGKAGWQSAFFVSKPIATVNSAVAILKSGITQTKDWWDLTSPSGTPEDAKLLPFLKRLTEACLTHRDPVTQEDFLDRWILGVKAACATAMVIQKVYPDFEEYRVREFRLRAAPEDASGGEQQGPSQGDPGEALAAISGAAPSQGPLFESELVVGEQVVIKTDLVDPFDFFVDTSGNKPEYCIQKIRGSVSDLERMDARAGYMEDAVSLVMEEARAGGGVSEEEDEQKDRAQESGGAGQAGTHAWDGFEYWGVVYDHEGAVMLSNHTVTVINDRVVRVMENPYQDGWPLRWSSMEPMPFSRYGRALLEPVQGVARAIIELANAVVDSVKYEVLKAWEVDLDIANDASEFIDGIKPGKVFTKKSFDGKERSLLRSADLGTMSQAPLAVLVQLDRMYGESVSIADIGLSPPRISTPPTAEEVRDRSSGTALSFRSIAQWLEKTSLEPALEAVFNAMMAFKVFGPGGTQWVTQVLGEVDARVFYALIATRLQGGNQSFQLPLKFKVTALSNIVARAQELEKIARLIEAANQVPGFLNRLNWDEVARKIVHNLGFDASEVILPEEELERVKALEERTQAGLAASAGQQPNSNSGVSAAGAASVTPAGT